MSVTNTINEIVYSYFFNFGKGLKMFEVDGNLSNNKK